MWIADSPKLAIIFLAVLIIIAISYRLSGPINHEHVATTEQIIWGEGVEPDNIACLSLNRRIGNYIFKTDYSDHPEILRSLRKFFSDKRISLNDPGCEYVLTFDVIAADTRAVRHLGQISRLLMSFAISRKDQISGALDKNGLYKNVYGFRTDLQPIEAFELGLRAFLTPQKTRWETMVIDTSRP